jgi:hypothetical protein
MIKHQKQYLGDMLNVGYHAIRGHKDVYMILEENLPEQSSKLSYKIAA